MGSSIIWRFSRVSTLLTFIRRSFNVVGLLTLSVFLLLLTLRQYKAYYKWDEAVKIYQIASYEESCRSFSEIYGNLKLNGPFLQYYGKALYLNGNYKGSIEMLERAVWFTSDEILYCSLGDSYKQLENTKKPKNHTGRHHLWCLINYILFICLRICIS